MKAHRIIETVQREQRRQFGVNNPKTVIAVTPTYARTFQALHLTGVMHSLMLVPYDVVWIVVEAGGVTNETASIVSKSGLRIIHVGFDQRMPNTWEGRHLLEARMRLHALRIVREQKLDGIVMFADDSNMHSMELFDEMQNVKWFGAVSVGILAHSENAYDLSDSTIHKKEDGENPSMPVQGPACNSSNKAPVLPRKLEWAGFVLNSRLLWNRAEDKPEWVKDLDGISGADEDIGSPLFLLKDLSMVEPLGNCGRQVLLWWLRVEARFDSKFPPRWTIDPPLEITVPSKRTPWPDAPPELPSDGKVETGVEEHIVKHSTKIRTTRVKKSSRSKRKRETKMIDTQATARHTEQN
ncbi:putative beta-1 4-xylosyltransferase IRX14H [Prunus yedoensis var. nudiflora]|uniref:Glycosyltransferases n=1 Tax=Prunus yedoensis var. nudiflora TaxID=2094558 RepID=A0A314ZEA7_PRUYE|nr:putative beta-1 4-xylosyltransferase IRX14H [Prunus yedoensis var. nudiflora]